MFSVRSGHAHEGIVDRRQQSIQPANLIGPSRSVQRGNDDGHARAPGRQPTPKHLVTSTDGYHDVGLAEPFKNVDMQFSRAVLTTIPDRLRQAQHTFEETGGLHAAAAFNSQGDLSVTMEDVGRHNAVDKVVGSLLLNKELPANKLGIMVSGRASFELMQKTLVAGIPLLAAVSAPSSLAVQLAVEFNMSLIGFLRGNTFNIYAGQERIIE